MLRCRPSEITLAPSDIAYAKHRFALQQVAQRDRSANFSGVLASKAPRIRRGPQRSRDDAVVHPNNRPTQQSNPRPSRDRPRNLVGNTDGAGDVHSVTSGSGASFEELADEGVHLQQPIEKDDGTTERGIRRSPRNKGTFSHINHDAKVEAKSTGWSIAQETDYDDGSGLISIPNTAIWPKPEVGKAVKDEDKIQNPASNPIEISKLEPGEVPGYTFRSLKPYVPRSQSTKAIAGELAITKRAIPPQLKFLGRPRNRSGSEDLRLLNDSQFEGGLNTVSDISLEPYVQLDSTKSHTNAKLMVASTDHETDFKSNLDDRAIVKQSRTSRLLPLSRFDILSHSAHDLTGSRLGQWKIASFKSLHDPDNISDTGAYKTAPIQKQACLGGKSMVSLERIIPQKLEISNLDVSYRYAYPSSSSSSSRHSSYASISRRYGLPKSIPARRSSLDTLNVLNVSCYGRSCSCSSPSAVGAVNNYPAVPNPPKVKKGRPLMNRKKSLSSVNSGTSSATRLSSISEAAPEAVIHLCSPLEQVQHYFARLGRSSESISPLKWELLFSETDQRPKIAKEGSKNPRRLHSDPIYPSFTPDRVDNEETRHIKSNPKPVLLSSLSGSPFSGGHYAPERAIDDDLLFEQTPVATTKWANIEQFQPASAKANSFSPHTAWQRHNSIRRQWLSYPAYQLTPSSSFNDSFLETEALLIVEADGASGNDHHPSSRVVDDILTGTSSSETDITNTSENRASDISTASASTQITSSLPWHLTDAHLQQENRSDEDEEQMRMALQNMQLRTVGNSHGERMDETPPREGRIERFLRV